MLDGFGPWHIAIVALLFVVLFGYKKLPDASKSIARSLRIFKHEMKGFHEDETPANPATQQTPQLPAVAPVVAQPPAAPAPVFVPPVAEHVPSGDHVHHP